MGVRCGGRPVKMASPPRRSRVLLLFWFVFTLSIYFLSLYSIPYLKASKTKTINLDLQRAEEIRSYTFWVSGFGSVEMCDSDSACSGVCGLRCTTVIVVCELRGLWAVFGFVLGVLLWMLCVCYKFAGFVLLIEFGCVAMAVMNWNCFLPVSCCCACVWLL